MLVDLRVYCDEPDLALALRGPSLLRGRSVTSIPKVCSSSTRERVLLHNPFLLSLRESMRSSRGGFVGAAYSAVDGVSAVAWHVCHRDLSVALPGAASQPGISSLIIATVAVPEQTTPHGISPVSEVARRLAQLSGCIGKR